MRPPVVNTRSTVEYLTWQSLQLDKSVIGDEAGSRQIYIGAALMGKHDLAPKRHGSTCAVRSMASGLQMPSQTLFFFYPSERSERGERACIPERGRHPPTENSLAERSGSPIMGRKPRRKFTLRKVSMTPAFAVGALATLDVISAAGTSATTNTLCVMSIDVAWAISDLGASIDDAFQFGVAHSDYSAAEIEECLEATSSMDLGNKVEQERANRLVRSIGIITQVGAASVTGGLNFNDGRPKKTKLNWLLSIGDTLDVWVRNGSGSVYTTGSILSGIGHLWVKD